jgi:hypothetical protein
MLGNAYRNSPIMQARMQANARNPEWVRHRETVRAAKGKFLNHFKMRDMANEWMREWVSAGKPNTGMPDFPEWLEARREELTLKRDTAREDRRLTGMIHQRWVDAGMPQPWITRTEEAALAIEEFKRTSKPKMAAIAEAVAAYNVQFYRPKEDAVA